MTQPEWPLIVALSVATLASSGCTTGFPSQAAQVPASIDSGYVDSARCAECHQSVARTYRVTGMARSVYHLDSSSKVEDFHARNSFEHKASGRVYEMIERSGKFFQRRHETGFGGKLENVNEKQIDFVVGSGNHARTYLHRTKEGKLIELPVSWYSEKGGYWAMSPGYDRPDPEDFRRAIPYDCLFCHNAYPPEGQVSDMNSDEATFGDRLPEGIDCQRCHGPGRAHIEATRGANATAQSIRGSITNPARLNRERQLEICMQCHLETTSSMLPGAIRRYDRGPFSYRPGQPLGDYAFYFDHAPGRGRDDDVEVAHAAYRLRKSACFRMSQMTCTTCHNPHDTPRGRQAVEHYTAVCQRCHASSHSSGNARHAALSAASSCIDCHMPKRRTDDVVHVVMTDHYIQRRKPSSDLAAPRDERAPSVYRGEVVPYYPVHFPNRPDGELYLALAQVMQGSNLAGGIPRLQQALAKYKPRTPQFYFELGRAFLTAGNKDEAIHWYQEALRQSKGFRPALRELAAALTTSGQMGLAVEAGGNAAAPEPPDAVVLSNLGSAYLQQGNIDRAVAVLQRALSVNSELPGAANLLGLAQVRKGDLAAADASFRDALRIQPDLAEAHYNLGNLLAGAGNYPEAAFHFEKAIVFKPGYVDAHHSYGILLMMTHSWDKALAEMREALRLDPSVAETHIELADLLATTGRIENAVEEYRRAIRLKPEESHAYYRLGLALRKHGDLPEAEQQFRLAIRYHAEYHEAHLALAEILAANGNGAEARVHFQRAAESADPEIRQAALRGLQ